MKAVQRWAAAFAATLLLAACDLSGPPPAPSPTVEPSATEGVVVGEEPTPLQITYNHHLIPSLAAPLFDEELRTYYDLLVDAVLTGETSFPLPEGIKGREDSWRASAVFGNINPLGGLVFLSSSVDGSTQIVDYVFDAAEHARRVAEMGPRAEELIAEILTADANAVDAVLAVYQNLAQNTVYTQEGALTGPYGVIFEGEGMCVGFGAGSTWLLEQAGFPVSHPATWDSGTWEIEGHTWFTATLNGESYHFDPTFENGVTGGYGLVYFGMTDSERDAEGGYLPFALDWVDDVIASPTATDTGFAPLRETVFYHLDQSEHLVWAEMPDGGTLAFSTETLEVLDTVP